MLNDIMTMLILSCDNFSDLWDGHVKLLDENWPDRGMDTFIVTEGGIERKYDKVKIFSAGEGLEWSERLQSALKTINTKYVLITLDDYFLIERVDNERIEELIRTAENEDLDYIRLYARPKRATRKAISGTDRVKWIDTEEKYSVNLYTAIWKTDFLRAMLIEKKNAWEFETGLSRAATAYNAKCAVSLKKEFKILDVVRKGKLLHKSAAYFKKHPELYSGGRPIQPWSYEIKLWIKTMVARHTPKFLYNIIWNCMRKLGYKFISDESGE